MWRLTGRRVELTTDFDDIVAESKLVVKLVGWLVEQGKP
jgi:hypothetical protein